MNQHKLDRDSAPDRQKITRGRLAARNTRNRESGFALIVVLLLVLVSSIVGLSQSNSARTEVRIAHNNQLGIQAMALAEAGIYHGFRLLQNGYSNNFTNDLASGGTAGALTALGTLVDLDSAGVNYRYAVYGGGSGDGYYVRALDNFDETPNNDASDSDQNIRLRSRGRIGTAERMIEARVIAIPGYGLFGKTQVDISGGSVIDSYDGTSGYPSGAGNLGNIGSNVNVHMNNAGDVVNGAVSSGGTVTGAGTVNGTTTVGAPPVSFPSVTPCSPYSDGITGFSGAFTYNAVTGDLSVNGTDNITLDPGNYCFNEFKLTGSATLTINSGPVVISLTGDGKFGGGGIINSGGNPADLRLESSFPTLSYNGANIAYMSVYAPDTAIDLSKEFYGSMIGDTLTITGGAAIHVDENLATSSGLTITSWREVRNQ